ncbi:MAG: hypothetical protein HN742_35045 [Lentisphaerae bacterium]|nr:hypothetical protein [Lentisphaerota bacterium]MBT4816515.1 hypothetical protein [Lentisphaerota bacterium]MBT5609213.1 hypothetical protein [Lentisphaerota bacterium]MBT7060051.1 hypothetical protein [Lentisphaerota bacterium]MBT7847141.1 hypothetical protein [Lentisphaerota bacterium]
MRTRTGNRATALGQATFRRNRHPNQHELPRPLGGIGLDIAGLEKDIMAMLKEATG